MTLKIPSDNSQNFFPEHLQWSQAPDIYWDFNDLFVRPEDPSNPETSVPQPTSLPRPPGFSEQSEVPASSQTVSDSALLSVDTNDNQRHLKNGFSTISGTDYIANNIGSPLPHTNALIGNGWQGHDASVGADDHRQPSTDVSNVYGVPSSNHSHGVIHTQMGNIQQSFNANASIHHPTNIVAGPNSRVNAMNLQDYTLPSGYLTNQANLPAALNLSPFSAYIKTFQDISDQAGGLPTNIKYNALTAESHLNTAPNLQNLSFQQVPYTGNDPRMNLIHGGQQLCVDNPALSLSDPTLHVVPPFEHHPTQRTSQIYPNQVMYAHTNPSSHTNVPVYNTTQLGVDHSQYPYPTNAMPPTTGYIAYAGISNAMIPSTLGASNAACYPGAHSHATGYQPIRSSGSTFMPSFSQPSSQTNFYQPRQPTNSVPCQDQNHLPTTSQWSNPSSLADLSLPNMTLVPESTSPPKRQSRSKTASALRVEARRRKRGRQLVPDKSLWTKTEDGQFACLYVGPASQGPCESVVQTLRNLGRHMREVHACRESPMDIPDDQKVAINGMPDALKLVHVACPYEDGDLHKCRYYREMGRRWETTTMDRKSRPLREHALMYHD